MECRVCCSARHYVDTGAIRRRVIWRERSVKTEAITALFFCFVRRRARVRRSDYGRHAKDGRLGSIVCGLVEDNDETPHHGVVAERRARDKFLDDACRRAGLPLIRSKTARRYDLNEIRERVKTALPKGACEARPSDVPAPLKGGRPPA